MYYSVNKPRVRFDIQGGAVAFSQKEALRKLHATQEYKQLRQLIGAHFDDAISCEGSANLNRGLNAQSNLIRLVASNLGPRQVSTGGATFRDERDMFLKVRAQIADLYRDANKGALSAQLRTEYLSPEAYGATDADSNLEKAVKWVFSTDADTPEGQAAEDIRAALEHAVAQQDVRTTDTADQLHEQLVNQSQLPPTRRFAPGLGYCSSGVGRALQDGMEVLSKSFELKPRSGAAAWKDLACFLYGAHSRAQAYVAGTKMTARALYAVAMLQSGRPFRAPNAALEQALMGAHLTD